MIETHVKVDCLDILSKKCVLTHSRRCQIWQILTHVSVPYFEALLIQIWASQRLEKWLKRSSTCTIYNNNSYLYLNYENKPN